MQVESALLRPYRLRMQRPLRTAAGLFMHRDGWLLRLVWRDDAGRRWHSAGDGAAWPGFGSGAAPLGAALQNAVTALPGLQLATIADLHTWLAPRGWPPEVHHALELACLDALGQAAGLPVSQLLGANPRSSVPVHVLVNDAVAAKQAVRNGARAIKMKVGALRLDEDILRVGAMRVAIGDHIALRIDANGAWPVAVALRAAKLLAAFSPQWLEQPTADIDGLRAVRELGAVPVAADESVRTAADLEAVLQAQAADVVVLKPMFVGGLIAAVQLHRQAHAAGVRSIVTHALESAVGRLGAAHVAACWSAASQNSGGPDCVADPEPCGLSDPLAEDVAAGPKVDEARCWVPAGPGLGVVWREAVSC